jgi:hypothetical protein
VPTWFGLCALLGFPAADPTPPKQRILGLLINIGGIIIASLITYAAVRMRGDSLKAFH